MDRSVLNADPTSDPRDVEILRLRSCLKDLGSLVALSTVANGDPLQVADVLLATLVERLQLDFAYLRLNHKEEPIELAETRLNLRPTEIGDQVRTLGSDDGASPLRLSRRLGGKNLLLAAVRLGLHSETGLLVTGSDRPDFPNSDETLLLTVSANHLALVVHDGRKRRTDADSQERSEEALRMTGRDARLIIDNIPAGAALMEPNGAVQVANNRIVEYFGKTLEELKQWGTSDAIHPEDMPRALEAFVHSVESGEPYFLEGRMRRYDGVYRWFHVHGLPILDATGTLTKWCVLHTDIDEQKRAEEAVAESERNLHRLRSELAHAARVMSLGVLSASVAHEVNQPISGIITNASTCLKMLSSDPPNVAGALETARRTIRDGHRASEVVTRLRALFGKKELVTKEMDLNDATREVIALSSHELQRHQITVRTELSEEPLQVVGDRVQIQQVILNLILNACDALKGIEGRSREIFVSTTDDGSGSACLTVRDTGRGLAPDSLDKLFDPFYTTKPDGMGIGLSVSHSIIENHSGRLWASRNQGPGASFSFSIPY